MVLNTGSRPCILVTGGAGYIGAHSCAELFRQGYLPISFDNLSRGFPENVKWGPLVVGDLLNPSDIESVFSKFPIEAVLHLAGLAYVDESVKFPDLYMQQNFLGTQNLLAAMEKFSISNLIFSSSCSVYGSHDDCVDENSSTEPINPYGLSKLLAEQSIHDWAEAGAVSRKAIALRYFNIAGDGGLGIRDGARSRIFPRFLTSVMMGEVLQIYGSDFETPDGTCLRDYVHVDDVVAAHSLALEAMLSEKVKGYDVFNVSSQVGLSNLDIAKQVSKVSGFLAFVEYCPRRDGDSAAIIGSNKKIEHSLHWRACRSNVKEIAKSIMPAQIGSEFTYQNQSTVFSNPDLKSQTIS